MDFYKFFTTKLVKFIKLYLFLFTKGKSLLCALRKKCALRKFLFILRRNF